LYCKTGCTPISRHLILFLIVASLVLLLSYPAAGLTVRCHSHLSQPPTCSRHIEGPLHNNCW